MALLGINATGNVWPGELEVSSLNAPSEVFKLDPTLPIIGVDPKFPSDQVVIGRGRLVGLKGTATNDNTTISQTAPGADHETVLTLAGGTVAPIGFASYNLFKNWAEHLPGNRPVVVRNKMIAVPYSSTINDVYGDLAQGDKVTAYNSTNPNYKGAVAKWVGKQVFTVVAASTAAIVLTGTNPNVPCKVLASWTSSSGATADSTVTANATAWTVAPAASGTVTVVEYGFGSEMNAGEVYGIETNTDVPGYLKWVTDGFGAWQLPPMYKATTSTDVSDDNPDVLLGGNSVGLKTSDGSNDATKMLSIKIDPAKDIKIQVNKRYVSIQGADGTWSALASADAWTVLPKASFAGADNTQGANYTVNPFNGTIQFWGIGSDATGTALTSAELDDIKVSYSVDSLGGNPAYGSGQMGYSDGTGLDGNSYAVSAGTPPQYASTAIAGGTGLVSMGILRVAIH